LPLAEGAFMKMDIGEPTGESSSKSIMTQEVDLGLTLAGIEEERLLTVCSANKGFS
jgi:hypothetical protein